MVSHRISHFPMPLLLAVLIMLGLWAQTQAQAQAQTVLPDYVTQEYGTPPPVPTGPLSDDVTAAIKIAFVDSMINPAWGPDQTLALETITRSKDPRLAWIVSDLMRFVSGRDVNNTLAAAASDLLGKRIPRRNAWGATTDHLIAWDIPAPPDYLAVKRAIFTGIIPGWDKIFVKGNIDWRHVSWGGVLIDDRAYDTTDEKCNCIPAVDNPDLVAADEATWLKDDTIVFGVEINGEARAYSRRIMEVREMVNDTLGGRDLGIPYCTLCGAAQAYFTDGLPAGVKRPVLRTSGLLIRSNKVMYDITTHSVFDTFTGAAVTGPLGKRGLKLKQAAVITTDWATWKKEYPHTTVLAEKYALGRNPDFRNGRDANGPIFPVGDVDPRLSVHEDIIGVIAASGRPVAFQRSKAVAALRRGETIRFENVTLVLAAGGVKAVNASGKDLGSHQAFWFAWSQFHPQTVLWAG